MIETRDLVYEYGSTRVLDGISLRIEDGEFLVLAGPNGSGKTTLVRQFNGLYEPTAGEVLVNGTPVAADRVAARTSVGLVFQYPRDSFVAATVEADVRFGPENLGLTNEEIDARVDAALEAVDMVGRADDRLDRLSGGEQARIAIAGALAMRPDHLVLDEPLTGLDWPARRRILGRLETLHEAGTSVVVVTHDLRDLAQLATRVVVLDDGDVVLDGPPATVRPELAAHGVRPP